MTVANWTNSQVIAQLVSGSKWSGSTISYAFPSAASGIYSQGEAATFRPVNASQQSLFVLALQNWDDLIPQTFQLTSLSGSNIEFGYTTSNIDYAHAYYPTNGSAWFKTGSDVATASVGSYGFLTVMHEIGHALGLNHMGNYNGQGSWMPSSYQDSKIFSIMSYFGPDGGLRSTEVQWADWTAQGGGTYSPQTPMLNDVLAIQTIYGTSTTTRTGDTVYGFSSNVTGASASIYDFTINRNPILTVFDSGGTDTLDFSGWNISSYIYLESGAYSSCDGMTNNITIAYGCIVENAVGGGGNDALTGNSSANRLDGGGGNDQLDGGAGNDTIVGGSGDDTAIFAGAFSSYAISYDAASGVFTISGAASGTDSVSGVEYFQFSDVRKPVSQLMSADAVAPTLSSLSPADNAASASPATDLVLSFSEAVKAGTGNFIIYNANGSVARTIAVTDASQVSISGSTVTINPATDLAAGSSYYVNIAAGVIKDLAGNSYAGLAGSTAYNFTTAQATADTTAPTLTSLSPADNATGVSPTGNLVLGFSETVQAGSGNLLIYNANGTVARTIAVTDTSQVTISGSTLTINPTADLAASSGYYLNIASGVIRDLAGNGFAGISGTSTYNFSTGTTTATDDFPWSTTTTGVVVVNGGAASGSIETVNDNDLFKITLTAGTRYVFDLARTTGGLSDPYLILYSPTIDRLTDDDDSGGAQNSRITYTATTSGTYYLGVLDYSTGTGGYTVSAAIVDTSPPVLTGVSPTDNASGVSPGANLVLSFNETVQAGSGNFVIYNDNGSVARTIAVTDTSQVTISGSTVTINPTVDLAYGSSYYINIAAGALRDLAGNSHAGITGSTAYNFSTAAPAATDDYPWSSSTTGLVVVNGAGTRGTVDFVDDADAFKVTLSAGTTYVFSLTRTAGGLADPYLQLYSPSAELLAFDDDGAGSLNATITYTATASGVYFLGAMDQGSATGGYTISAATLTYTDDYPWSTSTSGVVVVNGSATNGVINAVDDADLFAITLTAGTSYVFDLARTTGGLTDPYLILYSPSVDLLVSDDDSAGSQNSRISFTATTSGTYYLGAMDYGSGTGAYRISATTAAATGITLNGTSANDFLSGTSGNDTLSGGVGNDTLDGGAGSDVVLFSGNLASYTLSRSGSSYTVRANSGSDGTDIVSGIESLRFADKTVNLTVQGKAAAAPQADVQRLSELYVAFFNRVPDADGLAYWIDQMSAGQQVNQIAESFYNAGVQYSSLTGFSSGMSNGDFVNVIYRNVLGRTTGADADGLAYWSGELASGRASHGSLVSTMLASAHTFKGDATWGWVANLLDNKITVANRFAIDWGLNYNTPGDSIAQGMAIAAAVTPTDTAQAIALIGVSASEVHLT